MSESFEIIARPATAPQKWKEVRTELAALKSTSVGMTASTIGVIGLLLVTFAWFVSGIGVSIAIACLGFAVVVAIVNTQAPDDYGRYATWIYCTVTPVDAEIELRVKFVDDTGGTSYKARIIDVEHGEELYDVKTIYPTIVFGESLCDEVRKAKVFRDPVNRQCVAAEVADVVVWLWEYNPF